MKCCCFSQFLSIKWNYSYSFFTALLTLLVKHCSTHLPTCPRWFPLPVMPYSCTYVVTVATWPTNQLTNQLTNLFKEAAWKTLSPLDVAALQTSTALRHGGATDSSVMRIRHNASVANASTLTRVDEVALHNEVNNLELARCLSFHLAIHSVCSLITALRCRTS